MPTAQRTVDPGLIEQLLEQPYRFEFFQAVRLLESWLKQHGVAQGRAVLDHLRFNNSLSLAFPASQVEALKAGEDGVIRGADDLLAAFKAKRLRHIHITPAFLGLLGGHGTMPLHYTERIAAQAHATRDEGPRAFLDLFSSRAVALFYQAWAKHKPECIVTPDGEDGYLPLLLALAGVQPVTVRRQRAAHAQAVEAPRPADDVDDATLAFFAAQFRARSVSASIVSGLLSDYFDVPVAMEQLVGCWQSVPTENLSVISRRNMTPGRAGILLGTRIYRRDARVRLRIGPLARANFERFVRDGSAARALKKLLGLFRTSGIVYEIRIVLQACEARPWRLAPLAQGGSRLGMDLFFLSRPATGDLASMVYLIEP